MPENPTLISAIESFGTRAGSVAKIHKDSIQGLISVLASIITRLEAVESVSTTFLQACQTLNSTSSRMTNLESWAISEGYVIPTNDNENDNDNNEVENNEQE